MEDNDQQFINHNSEVISSDNNSKKKISIKKILIIAIVVLIGIIPVIISIFDTGKKDTKTKTIKANNETIISEDKENEEKTTEGTSTSKYLEPSATLIPTKILTVSPTAKPISNPTNTPVPPTVYSPPAPRIDSISPSSGIVGQTITINGSEFYSDTAGSVSFCLQNNCYGAPIDSWNNNEIKAKVPGMLSQSTTYEVRVTSKINKVSNSTSFTLSAGQPIINSFNPSSGAKPGGELTLSGSNFGGMGEVRFYKDYPTLSGTGNIVSWSSTEIKITVPSGLQANAEYGIQVVASGAESSFKYYTLGSN